MKAVVFVDVQNDFVKGGVLGFGYPEKDNVPEILKFAEECRAKGYVLYATADTHFKTQTEDPMRLENGQLGYLHTLEGKRLPVEHCLEGTEGHKIVEGLVKDKKRNVIIAQSHIIDKHTFGSFDLLDRICDDFGEEDDCTIGNYNEPLDEIVLCGYCLSICVLANAVMLRARFPNTKITVVSGLCGDVDKTAFDAAVKVLQMQQIDVVEKIEG